MPSLLRRCLPRHSPKACPHGSGGGNPVSSLLLYKHGWIPAFAGMTEWGVRDAQLRSEWEGSGPHLVRGDYHNSHEFLKSRLNFVVEGQTEETFVNQVVTPR